MDSRQQLQLLLQQESELQFTEFTNDTAVALGLKLVEAARARSCSVTVDVCRNGQQLFHCALPGTSADNDDWIRRKNNVVNRYGHSSLYVGAQFRAKGATFEESSRLDPGARLTIGKRLSTRLYLTYSRSLSSSTRDQIVLLEYDQTDQFSWILSRNEDGTYALDVRMRRAF